MDLQDSLASTIKAQSEANRLSKQNTLLKIGVYTLGISTLAASGYIIYKVLKK
jgi:hypothetical protein